MLVLQFATQKAFKVRVGTPRQHHAQCPEAPPPKGVEQALVRIAQLNHNPEMAHRYLSPVNPPPGVEQASAKRPVTEPRWDWRLSSEGHNQQAHLHDSRLKEHALYSHGENCQGRLIRGADDGAVARLLA